jgi:hypothetical protein
LLTDSACSSVRELSQNITPSPPLELQDLLPKKRENDFKRFLPVIFVGKKSSEKREPFQNASSQETEL